MLEKIVILYELYSQKFIQDPYRNYNIYYIMRIQYCVVIIYLHYVSIILHIFLKENEMVITINGN